MAQIIQGNDLMLFMKGKSIAFATSHQLSISSDIEEINSKDHGNFSATLVKKINWEITSENLFTSESYDTLFTAMMEKRKLKAYFGLKKEKEETKTVANGDYENWTPENAYGGEVYITSLTTSANSGDKATFSLTLKGSGKISKVDATAMTAE